jgi:hypothetical protein
MNVGLLAPLFLAGLAAVAIPILVHLVRREERTSFAFPSLMFLKHIPVREHRRRTIRHWWLLMLRCAIIALLCIAFAQPFIEWSSDRFGSTGDGHDRIVLLDRSHSMEADGAWEDALRIARDAVDTLEPGDRAALLLFDHETLLTQELTPDRAVLRAALARAEIGHGHTDLAAAITRAGALLEESDAALRDIVVISDFQRSAVTAGEGPRLGAGVDVIPRAVGGGDITNAAVAAVTLERTPLGTGGAVDLSARIVNTGTGSIVDTDLVLEVNGEERERRTLSLAPGESHDAPFRLVLARDELLRTRIHVGTDDLAADDSFHLLVSGPTAISVLLLEDRGTRPGKTLHLRQALQQGDAPGFRVTTRSVSQLRAADIDGADVIIINDAPIPGGAPGEMLHDFLASGGGLLVVAGERIQGTWPAGDGGIVPGRLGPVMARPSGDAGHLLRLDTLHPALAAFAGSDGGDLSAAQIFRYRGLSGVDDARVLARYDDEGIAVAERQVGNGRTLVLTTTLDPSWNTLALEPGYLPFLHEALKYLASHVPGTYAVSVGDSVDLESYARGLPGYAQTAAALSRGTVTTLRTPSGRRVPMAAGNAFARVHEAGFHEVHVSGGGSRSLVFAANPTPAESDPAVLDVDAFIATIGITEAADETATQGGRRGATIVSKNAWWFLLLACALCLALDTLFSNRLSRPVQAS